MSRSESVAPLYQDEGNYKKKNKTKSKTKGTKMFMFADDIVIIHSNKLMNMFIRGFISITS